MELIVTIDLHLLEGVQRGTWCDAIVRQFDK